MIELRYSRAKFKTTLLVAIMLTVMITGVTWMILTRLGNPYANLITALTALIFFGFCTVGMLWRYYNNEVVFAVRRTGLFDKRWPHEAVNWEDIKEVVLVQREADFSLEVRLWPQTSKTAAEALLQIDLSPFDTSVQAIIDAIGSKVPLRRET